MAVSGNSLDEGVASGGRIVIGGCGMRVISGGDRLSQSVGRGVMGADNLGTAETGGFSFLVPPAAAVTNGAGR